jgi:outer membrane protein OmpA-like peptidoglycan-associated protein
MTKLVKAVALSVLGATFVQGCAPSALSHLPPELRSEASRRSDRCNELARGFRPSQNRSGGFSILGNGLNLQDVLQNQNSARDQYLAALSGLIASCRSWQNFEITTSEFRQDRLEFASVYTASVDNADDPETQETLIAALARVEAGTSANGLQEAIDQFREAANSWTADPALSQQLADIAARLRAIEVRGAGPMLTGNGGGPEGAGQDSDLVDPSSLEPVLVLRFPTRSSAIDANMSAELAALATNLSDRRYVVVLGYADLAGPAAVNASLSLERAQNAAGRLRDLGVRVTHVAGAGETAEFGEALDANRLAIVLSSSD